MSGTSVLGRPGGVNPYRCQDTLIQAAPQLDGNRRVAPQIQIPGGVGEGTAVGGYHLVGVPFDQVQQRTPQRAELVRRHAANLPIARTLQVGLTGGAD